MEGSDGRHRSESMMFSRYKWQHETCEPDIFQGFPVIITVSHPGRVCAKRKLVGVKKFPMLITTIAFPMHHHLGSWYSLVKVAPIKMCFCFESVALISFKRVLQTFVFGFPTFVLEGWKNGSENFQHRIGCPIFMRKAVHIRIKFEIKFKRCCLIRFQAGQ